MVFFIGQKIIKIYRGHLGCFNPYQLRVWVLKRPRYTGKAHKKPAEQIHNTLPKNYVYKKCTYQQCAAKTTNQYAAIMHDSGSIKT